MKKEPIIVNVYLWGTCIGKLNWDFEKHCSVFQFSDEYRKQDYDISPSTHSKRTPLFASFYGNKDKLYQGLPEFHEVPLVFWTSFSFPLLLPG